MKIKDMFGMMVAVPIAGASMAAVGGVTTMSAGLRSATQIGIGAGLASNAFKMTKMKW